MMFEISDFIVDFKRSGKSSDHAEPEPKRIGSDQYASVGAFRHGLCPVSKPNKGLMYINVISSLNLSMP